MAEQNASLCSPGTEVVEPWHLEGISCGASQKCLQLEGKFFVFFAHFQPFSKRINSVERQFFVVCPP